MWLLPCVWMLAASAAAPAAQEAAARRAVVAAVEARMGDDARVTLERLVLRITGDGSGSWKAVVPPGSRTGRPVAFALFAGIARVGTATALVRVQLPHTRAAAPVARDATLTTLDLVEMEDEVTGVLFERLPRQQDLVGARVRRDVAAGEPLTHATVETAYAVRSGDDVEVVARVGSVEARGLGKASGSGRVGERVRVTRGGQPGLATAVVVAPGVVELTDARRVAPRTPAVRPAEERD